MFQDAYLAFHLPAHDAQTYVVLLRPYCPRRTIRRGERELLNTRLGLLAQKPFDHTHETGSRPYIRQFRKAFNYHIGRSPLAVGRKDGCPDAALDLNGFLEDTESTRVKSDDRRPTYECLLLL